MTTNGVGFCRDELVDTESGEAQPLYKYAHATTECFATLNHLHPAPTGCPFESGCMVLLLYQGRSSFHIAFTNMFFNVAPRTSDAVAVLQVSPVLGVVLVEFTSGHAYEYTNVSRRAIANLLLNPNMSLGFWVNQNCIAPERTKRLDLNFYTTDGANRGAAGFIAA